MSIAVNGISVEDVGAVPYNPCHKWVLQVCLPVVVLLDLYSQCPDLSKQSAVCSFNASLCCELYVGENLTCMCPTLCAVVTSALR